MSDRNLGREVYRLGFDLDSLDLLFSESEGEATEETDRLEAWIGAATDQTVGGLAAYVRELDGVAAMAKAESQRLAEVQRHAAERQAWAKGQVARILERMETRKIQIGTTTVSLAKGSISLAGSVDPAKLEPRFARVVPEKREPDKAAIRAAIKAGEYVVGFSMVRGPDRVVIK